MAWYVPLSPCGSGSTGLLSQELSCPGDNTAPGSRFGYQWPAPCRGHRHRRRRPRSGAGRGRWHLVGPACSPIGRQPGGSPAAFIRWHGQPSPDQARRGEACPMDGAIKMSRFYRIGQASSPAASQRVRQQTLRAVGGRHAGPLGLPTRRPWGWARWAFRRGEARR